MISGAACGFLRRGAPAVRHDAAQERTNWYSAAQTMIGRVAVQAERRADAQRQQRVGDNG